MSVRTQPTLDTCELADAPKLIHFWTGPASTLCGVLELNHDCLDARGYFPVVDWRVAEVCPICRRPLCPVCALLATVGIA